MLKLMTSGYKVLFLVVCQEGEENENFDLCVRIAVVLICSSVNLLIRNPQPISSVHQT